jgi:hypothetical protein
MSRYGIEGIAQTYEDPFGVAKIDINMDDIVEDARREVEVMLLAWQNQGARGGIFRPHVRDNLTSESSSEYFSNEGRSHHSPEHSLLRVIVGDLSQQIQNDAAERERQRFTHSSSTKGGRNGRGVSGDEMTAAEDTPLLGVLRRNDSGISPGISMVGSSYVVSGASVPQDRSDPGDGSAPRVIWSDNLPGTGNPDL